MNQIDVFSSEIESNGPISPITLGDRSGLIIAEPHAVEHVLKSPVYGKGQAWQAMRRLLFPVSAGALSANDDLPMWRSYRVPVNRSLAPTAIRSLVEPMRNLVDEELDQWPMGQSYDLLQACARITQRQIVSVFFGADLSQEDSREVGDALLAVLYQIADEQHGGSEQRVVEQTASLQRVLKRLIQDSSKGIVTTFIDMDPAIGGEILLNLYLAGYESPSLAMSWTLSLLAKNPVIEQRMLAEIERNGSESTPTIDTMGQWPELSAALDESMRLYPPLWAMPREALEDDTLPSGQAVNKGDVVMLSVLHMHRLKSVWGDDADDFRPTRFQCPDIAAQRRRAFLPFGAGMRICPAEILSRASMMVALIRILRRFVIKLDSNPEWEPAFTLRIKGGLPATLVPREPAAFIDAA